MNHKNKRVKYRDSELYTENDLQPDITYPNVNSIFLNTPDEFKDVKFTKISCQKNVKPSVQKKISDIFPMMLKKNELNSDNDKKDFKLNDNYKSQLNISEIDSYSEHISKDILMTENNKQCHNFLSHAIHTTSVANKVDSTFTTISSSIFKSMNEYSTIQTLNTLIIGADNCDGDDDFKEKGKDNNSNNNNINNNNNIKNISINNILENAKKQTLKIVSWNVNSIRALIRKGDWDKFVKLEDPDIICLQEIKCTKEEFPASLRHSSLFAFSTDAHSKIPGYYPFKYVNSAEKKGYSGTAIFSKTKPFSVDYGMTDEKYIKEGRIVTTEFSNFYLVTCYAPNSQDALSRLPFRMEWDRDFNIYLNSLDNKKPVIVCGDFNVAHRSIDLVVPNPWEAGYTKEEREGFSSLLKSGFADIFREKYPKIRTYTCWSYKGGARNNNVGLRFDYFLVSRRLLPLIDDIILQTTIKGSDHCPVCLVLNLDSF